MKRYNPVGSPGLHFRGFFFKVLGEAIVQKKSGPTFAIPIVFAVVVDPVTSGLLTNFARLAATSPDLQVSKQA
jgi:hypothetical protein